MDFRDVMDDMVNKTAFGVIGLVSMCGLIILGTGYVVVKTWEKFGPCPKDRDGSGK